MLDVIITFAGGVVAGLVSAVMLGRHLYHQKRARLAAHLTDDTPPSADTQSIPSSVDPDADPLGECSRCGKGSRRAYSLGLCDECIADAEVSTR